MHESFQARVVPLTLLVLDVMTRIESSGGSLPEPEEIRPRLKNLLGQFNARGPRQQDFALAKSAMVFWIDEMLVNSSWCAASDWRDLPLEREIYGTRSRAWKFFENADLARFLEETDALETFAQCVALGFRGLYRGESLRASLEREQQALLETTTAEDSSLEQSVEIEVNGEVNGHDSTEVVTLLACAQDQKSESTGFGLQFPPTIEEWAGPLFTQIQGGGLAKFRTTALCDSPRSARPLTGLHSFIYWSAALAVGAVLSLGLLITWGWS